MTDRVIAKLMICLGCCGCAGNFPIQPLTEPPNRGRNQLTVLTQSSDPTEWTIGIEKAVRSGKEKDDFREIYRKTVKLDPERNPGHVLPEFPNLEHDRPVVHRIEVFCGRPGRDSEPELEAVFFRGISGVSYSERCQGILTLAWLGDPDGALLVGDEPGLLVGSKELESVEVVPIGVAALLDESLGKLLSRIALPTLVHRAWGLLITPGVEYIVYEYPTTGRQKLAPQEWYRQELPDRARMFCGVVLPK